MAQTFELRGDPADDPVVKSLTKSLQSGHISLLLGAGASHPAIPLAGDVEAEINKLLQGGDSATAIQKIYELLQGIQSPLNALIDGTPHLACTETLNCYRNLLRTLERILSERRTTVLPKQATIFSTNYDILIDLAAKGCEAATVANGFDRALVSDESSEYSSRRFFLTTFDTGNLYEYRVELPALNIVKLHGCISWARDTDRILMRKVRRDLPPAGASAAAIKQFVDSYSVILPQAGKFNATVLDRTYYELLRLFANSLDKENALLVAFGFSFRDEHILHITRRALTNPTLRVLVLAYDTASRQSLETIFAGHNNVVVVAAPDAERLDFSRFNKLLIDASPKG